MASGIISSVSFTPKADGRVVITCVYDIEPTSGDWGSKVVSKVFKSQGFTDYGEAVSSGTSRNRQVAQMTIAVAGGTACTVGLYGVVTGAAAGSWYNVSVTYTLLKR